MSVDSTTCRSCQREFPTSAGHRCGEGEAEASLRKTLADRDGTIGRLTRELTAVREAWTKERAGYDETTRVLGEKTGRAIRLAESLTQEALVLLTPCHDCQKPAVWTVGMPYCDACLESRGALPGIHHDVKPHRQAKLIGLMKIVAPADLERDAQAKNIAYLQANIAEIEGMLGEMPESAWIERSGFESLLKDFKQQLAAAESTAPHRVEVA